MLDPEKRHAEQQNYRDLLGAYNTARGRCPPPAAPKEQLPARRAAFDGVAEMLESYQAWAARVQADPDEGARQRLRASEQRAMVEKMSRMAKASGVPARHRKASLDDFSALPADCVAKYTRHAQDIWERISRPESDQIVVLISSGGQGKSHILAAVVRWFILGRAGAEPRMARFTTPQLIADEFDAAGRGGRDSALDLHAKYVRWPLLAIDEIDKPVRFPSDLERVQRILRERHESCLPTLVAGNAAQEDLPKLLSSYVLSRAKAPTGKLFVFDWADLRGGRLLPIDGAAKGV